MYFLLYTIYIKAIKQHICQWFNIILINQLSFRSSQCCTIEQHCRFVLVQPRTYKALTCSGLSVTSNPIPQTQKKDWYLYQSSLGGVSIFLPIEGSNAITRNQSRTYLRMCASKIRIGCQTGLLGKPFVLVLVRLLGGNA